MFRNSARLVIKFNKKKRNKMAKRTIFENDGNVLTTFINLHNEIYIGAGEDLHKPSKHSWGIAIDLDPARNKLINILL